MKNLVKLTFASIVFIVITSQSKPAYCIDNTFTFPTKIEKIDIPKEFKKYDAVILEEQLAFARTNSGISRHVRIKIQSKKGLEKYKKICLPESPDPTESIFLVPRYKAEKIHYPLGAPDMIVYFAARIIHPDGTIKEIKARDSLVKHTLQEFGETRKYFNYYYIFDELKVGDEIDIFYSYREIYYHNSFFNPTFNTWVPFRIFFNSEIPKIKYDLRLSATVQNSVKFTFENNALPLDTLYEKNLNQKDIILHWHYENLMPIKNIWNSHLYEELPHVKFYGAGDLVAKNSNNEAIGILEYPWNYVLRPYVGLKLKYDGYDRHFASITAYNNLHREVLANCADTGYINRVNYFHEYINHQFKFSDDVDYIKGDDILNPRLGKFIESKTLRRIGRNNLYKEILNRFDVPYYLVAVADKRIASIDFNKFNYGFGIPGIYCVTDQSGMYFIQPKNHQFGHHMNEFPFYYEGCPMILIPQREPEQRILNLGIAYLPNLVYVNSPSSNENDNSRKINSMISVKLSENKVDFNTKVSLSGQFSTLTRGFYSDEYIDSSVSSLYYKKFYQISPTTKLLNLAKTSEDSLFPYSTNFKASYSDASLIKKTNDSVYVLKLTELVQHAIEMNIDTLVENSFYPDFKQTDIYRYMIKFDQPIKLLDHDLNISIDNALGKYSFTVTQKSETDLMLESYLQITSDKVTKHKLRDVCIIGEQIQRKKSAEITLIAQKQ